MTFQVEIRGFKGLQELETIGKNSRRAAVRAINRTATSERTEAAREVRNQVAFPNSYLQPSQGNLIVSRKANPSKLEAVITARERPTSLSRFLRGGNPFGRKRRRALQFEIKPGRLTFMNRAFPVRLRRGAGRTASRYNLGIAIRLRKGESLTGNTTQIRLSPNVYLLYGPSVQQVLLDNRRTGVARNIERRAGRKIETEYLRQLNL